jgi:hypothetical protein
MKPVSARADCVLMHGSCMAAARHVARVHFLFCGVRMIVRWNQTSCMRVRNGALIG